MCWDGIHVFRWDTRELTSQNVFNSVTLYTYGYEKNFFKRANYNGIHECESQMKSYRIAPDEGGGLNK